MKRMVSSNEVFRVIQGYVAWRDCALEVDAEEEGWRATWAHLSSDGLVCYPHQYSKVPLKKYEVNSKTTVKVLKDAEMPNKIQINFFPVAGSTRETIYIQFALQSRIDSNRWVSGVANLVRWQAEDSTIRPAVNEEALAEEEATAAAEEGKDTEGADEHDTETGKLSESEVSESESEIIRTSTTRDEPTPFSVLERDDSDLAILASSKGADHFVKKKKKQRSARIHHELDSDSDMDDSHAHSLRDAITRDVETARKKPSADSLPSTVGEDGSTTPKSGSTTPTRPVSPASTDRASPDDSEESEASVSSPRLKLDVDLGPEDSEASSSRPGSARARPRRSKTHGPIEPERVKLVKHSVSFAEELLEPVTLHKPQLKAPPPKKSILKKASGLGQTKKKRPKIFLTDQPMVHWRLGVTEFESTVKNGITTVINPLFNPKDVELRYYLEELQRVHMETKERAVLDLSSRDLSNIPPIVMKQKYLNVLNLYMNQFQRLPSDIGTLTNLVQFGANENCLVELPASIGQLTNLDLLSVRNNSLTVLPDSIRKLSKLRVLDVHHNQLSKLPSLRGLTELVDLDAQYNQLGRLPKDISKLVNLKKLHLGRNKLKSLPVEICQLTNLVEI